MQQKRVYKALLITLYVGISFTANNIVKAIPQQSRTIFVHGLGKSKQQLEYYTKSKYIEIDAHAFNFYNDFLKISLGQMNEINTLIDTLENWPHAHNNCDIVLWGVSMGAATIINFFGSVSNNFYAIDAIKGIILESPFADVHDVIDCKICHNKWLSLLNYIPYAKKLIVKSKYPAHSLNGLQPIKCVCLIPRRIPILFIAIENDKIVPFSSTLKLYKALKNRGHKKCHLLTIKQGVHARLSKNEKENQILGIVHAFRKFYNLGNYIEQYAQAGRIDFLENTQPVFE